MFKRLTYWPPWQVTSWWKAHLFRGTDEWHNPSMAMGLPLLGIVVVFYGREFRRGGEGHWDYIPGCSDCDEIRAEVDSAS